MKAAKAVAKELFSSLDKLTLKLLQLVAALSDKQINTVPFKDSWTAGQVIDHVTKSITGITKALHIEGKSTARDPGEREQELKKMFLDFTVKFKSPEFILPTGESVSKALIMADLKRSLERLQEESDKVVLAEAINHRAFGEITKLELLHFVKFHMQRHLHQLKNISKIVMAGNTINKVL